MNLKNIPEELKELPHWVLWKLEERNGKKTKVPYQVNGQRASSTTPGTWASIQDVLNILYHSQEYSGIGFMLSQSGITGVDIDHCITDGKLTMQAAEVIELLNSYTEKSQSGTGVHILVKGKVPKGIHADIEMYSEGRYFVVTGDRIQGEHVESRQDEINILYEQFRKKDKPVPEKKAVSSSGGNNNHTDDELMAKAFASKEGFKIEALYNGNWQSLGYNSQSEADQALCNYLAFWLNKDWNSIDQAFKQSGLYRDKWDRQDYKAATIDRAINDCNSSYQELRQQASVPTSQANNKFYDLNDYGNGQRLVDTFGASIRYCNEWKYWMIYNGNRWIPDDCGALERLAKRVIEQIREEAFREEDERKQKALMSAVTKSGGIRGIKGMIEAAASEKPVRIKSNTFDQNKYLLNCKNGTVDLQLGIFNSGRPDDYITKVAEVSYDPAADCPRWKQFINEIMCGNKGLELFLQRAIGYSLTGATREQKMFICYGHGSNGKSILMEILRTLLNDYSRNIQAESLMLRDNKGSASGDIARLKGARFVTAKETKEGRKLDEALIKEATGADTITARFLYQNEFEFLPEFKLWLATNYKPEIKGQDEGIWRRLVLIPFNAEFTEKKGNKDPGLLDKLKLELPGILNWCIEGCMMWTCDGLKEPKEILEAVQEYRDECDDLQQFIDDYCILKHDAYVTNKDLTDAYNRWSNSNLTPKKFSLKFNEKARHIGVTQARKTYGTFWRGIGLPAGAEFKQKSWDEVG